ncbi:hypothetical protein HDA32_004649 [Spinactinospora alkalitolerans]|uniref:Uncharacterized protein n=1 Tax=Spinactinospora alkalitolerans TaxID=687207 RepID=A0A852TZV1_9ACTN|nr:hypothetical protein [Spinactinospora alkalitolerans]NYE49529.1 hypothetical protein [Spinactinospora alkalitolerans]
MRAVGIRTAVQAVPPSAGPERAGIRESAGGRREEREETAGDGILRPWHFFESGSESLAFSRPALFCAGRAVYRIHLTDSVRFPGDDYFTRFAGLDGIGRLITDSASSPELAMGIRGRGPCVLMV